MKNKNNAKYHIELADRIAKITSAIQARATAQLCYSLERMSGALTPDEAVDFAVTQALVAGMQAEANYRCERTIEIAEALLEDSNCHTEAKALHEAALANS